MVAVVALHHTFEFVSKIKHVLSYAPLARQVEEWAATKMYINITQMEKTKSRRGKKTNKQRE